MTMSEDNDFEEFGCSDDDSDDGIDSDLKAEFGSACQYLGSNSGHFQENDLLFFYAHYKQSLFGECKVPKPGFFDLAGKKKWAAWKALGALPQSNAMQSYIKRLREIDVNWHYDATSDKSNKHAATNRPSQPVREGEAENESDPFSLVSNGQIEKLRLLSTQLISSEPNFDFTSVRNDEGLTLLHLACDRGYHHLALFLINDLKIDIEAKDESGQTALHYAAFCGHLECVELLLKCGANPDCVDSDGQKPLDVCEHEEIQRALQQKGNDQVA